MLLLNEHNADCIRVPKLFVKYLLFRPSVETSRKLANGVEHINVLEKLGISIKHGTCTIQYSVGSQDNYRSS